MKKILFTGRLKLVPVEKEDCDLLLSMLHNNKIKKYLCDNKDIEREVVEKMLRQSDALFAEQDCGLWLIHDLEERAVMGLSGFMQSNPMELIYVVHPDFENKGFATEASLKVINHLYENHRQDLYARVDAPNSVSHKVANKLGMKEVGTEKNEVTGGDMTVYKLDSSESEA